MARALHLTTGADDYLMKYITPRDDIWVDVEFLLPTQLLIDQHFWYPWVHVSSNHVYHNTTFSNDWLVGVEADASYSPNVYFADEGFSSGAGVQIAITALRDNWHTLRYHVVKNVSVNAWVDATSIASTTEASGNQVQAVVLSQAFLGAPIWLRDVKIGTTAGASDILHEDWSSGGYSNWDVSSITSPSGIDWDPLGPIRFSITPNADEVFDGIHLDATTERLSLTPSAAFVHGYADLAAVERLALVPVTTFEQGPYGDIGTELLTLLPSADEHYCPEKVEFQGDLEGKWDGEEKPKWSAGFQSRWQGNFLGVGEGYAC